MINIIIILGMASDTAHSLPGETKPAALSAALEPTGALLTELAEKSAELESATPQQIIAWAAQRFGPRLTMATAFGPEGMAIIHMLAEIAPDTSVFNLETGYQFRETLELREKVRERYGIAVEFKATATYGRRIRGPARRSALQDQA